MRRSQTQTGSSSVLFLDQTRPGLRDFKLGRSLVIVISAMTFPYPRCVFGEVFCLCLSMGPARNYFLIYIFV